MAHWSAEPDEERSLDCDSRHRCAVEIQERESPLGMTRLPVFFLPVSLWLTAYLAVLSFTVL